MKFTSHADIAAPPGFVFADMTDFEGWETAVRKRNTTLSRSAGPIRPGTTWDARFRLRGKDRAMTITLVSVEPDRRIHLTLVDPSLHVDIVLDLIEVAANASRLAATVDLRPQNLTARLLVQSLRLARGNIQGQLDQRIRTYANRVAQDFRARTPRATG
ncbi:SRPBCC family protein [Falsirhodobacter halotolerans]|uniref:SRPBCC family protein n=1 Tax=Falsirhodobacter halotolerans TaxID=1146892 RepID=UPI001FD0A0DD|nr:SRPBCC family protein [Falsirhodobacter halotolerans]MCJ8140404.1 hypothetical protein [Falsirhodobacter halotolerans]